MPNLLFHYDIFKLKDHLLANEVTAIALFEAMPISGQPRNASKAESTYVRMKILAAKSLVARHISYPAGLSTFRSIRLEHDSEHPPQGLKFSSAQFSYTQGGDAPGAKFPDGQLPTMRIFRISQIFRR